jgi:creatinine amidohydrolase
VTVRPRVVRDAVVDWGASLARAGFRWILVASGHAGPTHLAALEEAAAMVSRRHGIAMASLAGPLIWGFRSGRFLGRVEDALGRALTVAERQAFADDAHAGWWETSMMLLLRPDLVGDGWRGLPPATYPLAARVVPNYPLRGDGAGYVGHPALADPAFARATSAVVVEEAMALVDAVLDGQPPPRSPFSRLPFFRTDFWPLVAAAAAGLAALAWLRPRGPS